MINLRPIIKYRQKIPFRIDTMTKALTLVKPQNLAISFDLSDAYMHLFDCLVLNDASTLVGHKRQTVLN